MHGGIGEQGKGKLRDNKKLQKPASAH